MRIITRRRAMVRGSGAWVCVFLLFFRDTFMRIPRFDIYLSDNGGI